MTGRTQALRRGRAVTSPGTARGTPGPGPVPAAGVPTSGPRLAPRAPPAPFRAAPAAPALLRAAGGSGSAAAASPGSYLSPLIHPRDDPSLPGGCLPVCAVLPDGAAPSSPRQAGWSAR